MLDKDESGMVEFPEFARVMAKRAEVEAIKKKTQEFRDALKVFLQKNTVDLTKKCMQVFDFNGDGKVSAAELGDILTKQGRNKLSDEEVEEMIESVDKVDIVFIKFNHFLFLFFRMMMEWSILMNS